MHGANGGRPIIHGRYSVKHRAKLAEKLDQWEQAPVDDLRGEVAMLRALTDEYLGRFEDGVRLTAKDIKTLQSLIDSVGTMAERVVKIRNSTALTAAEIALVVAGLTEWINANIPPEKRAEAIGELRSHLNFA